MRKLLIGLIIAVNIVAFEFTPYVGMAMHVDRFEDSNSKLDSNSPLGLFGVRAGFDYVSLWVNHISSIPDVGLESRGLNLYGLTANLPIGNTVFYGGYFGHSERFDGKYYSKRFDKYMYRIGVKYNYDGDKELFIDYIKSKDDNKVNALMYGFRMSFRDII